MTTRRLYRSRRERLLGGVSGGLAEYFDLDPTLIRMGWILLTLMGGSGLLIYLIAWVIVPENPGSGRRVPADAEREPGPAGHADDRELSSSGRGLPALLLLVALVLLVAMPLLLLLNLTILGGLNLIRVVLVGLGPLLLIVGLVAVVIFIGRRRE